MLPGYGYSALSFNKPPAHTLEGAAALSSIEIKAKRGSSYFFPVGPGFHWFLEVYLRGRETDLRQSVIYLALTYVLPGTLSSSISRGFTLAYLCSSCPWHICLVSNHCLRVQFWRAPRCSLCLLAVGSCPHSDRMVAIRRCRPQHRLDLTGDFEDCFLPISFGWAVGDVSLAAYIQTSIFRMDFPEIGCLPRSRHRLPLCIVHHFERDSLVNHGQSHRRRLRRRWECHCIPPTSRWHPFPSAVALSCWRHSYHVVHSLSIHSLSTHRRKKWRMSLLHLSQRIEPLVVKRSVVQRTYMKSSSQPTRRSSRATLSFRSPLAGGLASN